MKDFYDWVEGYEAPFAVVFLLSLTIMVLLILFFFLAAGIVVISFKYYGVVGLLITLMSPICIGWLASYMYYKKHINVSEE